MNRLIPMNDRSIQKVLDARARRDIADATDLWPRVQQAILTESQLHTPERPVKRTVRNLAVVLTLCLAVVTSSVAVAAAASPDVRHFLQNVVTGIPRGAAGSGLDVKGQPFEIQPLPTFPLFYPRYQPAGLLIHGSGQINPRYGTDGFGATYTCSNQPKACLSLGATPAIAAFFPTQVKIGMPSLLVPFQGSNADVVWFGSHGLPPDNRFVQIAEWDATSYAIKSFSSTSIPQLSPGHLETTVLRTRGRTTIAIQSNLGILETTRLANSLQPISPLPQ